MDRRTFYQLLQLLRDPRHSTSERTIYGESFYGVYTTLEAAQAVAKSELKDCLWIIYKVVAVQTNAKDMDIWTPV